MKAMQVMLRKRDVSGQFDTVVMEVLSDERECLAEAPVAAFIGIADDAARPPGFDCSGLSRLRNDAQRTHGPSSLHRSSGPA
ncbi:hypothetical protein [Herbaspirillum sp. GW103]|uniref:hypothetical protein n=1 Tax=Herbaspirillum sp. GW103 TaxID=1175306 RepID=UPI00054FCFE6|nr:hypothetical protein [Herbaspirillum sp. GW103]